MKLPREFYLTDGVSLAKELLGKVLVHDTPEGRISGIIVETESYMGPADKAAHSYKASSFGRTNVQYGPGGYAYIYLIYGMHSCMNVVANGENVPEAVLIRALQPLEGIERMQLLRNKEKVADLCSGPGKLCEALMIDRSLYGEDLCGDRLFLEEGPLSSFEIGVSKRINVDYAEEAADFPYRFYVKGNNFTSLRESSKAFLKYALEEQCISIDK